MWSLYLNLTLPLPRGGFIDGHLDGLLIVGDHDGAERGVVGVDLGVVHGPEAVEHQVLLIPTHQYT